MNQRQVKWSREMRSILYARLTMEFGSYHEWGRSFTPKDTARYQVVLRELATYLGRLGGYPLSWKAVKNQVDWACTKQDAVKDSGHARQFILNKAAAVEMLFLKGSELPSYLLTESE